MGSHFFDRSVTPDPPGPLSQDNPSHPNYLFCIPCLDVALRNWEIDPVLNIRCMVGDGLSEECSECHSTGEACNQTPMGMLGEAYYFIKILEWARQALSLKREEKYLTLVSTDPEETSWGSHPNLRGVVKQAIARLGTAFRKAIDIHLLQYGLDIKELYRDISTEYIQYRKLMMQKLHLQYETLRKPIDFPHTLCCLGPEESGFVAWQSAIRSFFEGIATEVEKTDMSALIYGQAERRRLVLEIRNEASPYTLPW